MKLVLDENLPHQLRHELPDHECCTVTFLGWAGTENGALLMRAFADGFDALITKDSKMHYQQNLATLPVAVVVLHARSNDIDDLRPLIPQLLTALATLTQKSVTHIPES